MHPILLYPIFPALTVGVVNWLYWKKKGHTSLQQLFVGACLSYVVFYSILKAIW